MPGALPRRIFLDPDGTWTPDWMMVVVAAPTGVFYEQQCAGVATQRRELEGFLVPIGGFKLRPEAGRIDPDEFTAVFHDRRACVWGEARDRLPADRLVQLRELVGSVPFWAYGDGGEEVRAPLELDESRLAELAEAWVPVRTANGAGVLVWNNCD
jgi:Family of unknown function (DUF6210)